MSEISQKVARLISLNQDVAQLLFQIEATRETAALEIAGEGLTQETCEAMAGLLRRTERKSLKVYKGLVLVHEDMAEKVPEGMNEGQKPPWP